jgi:hypothetical protein
MKTTEKEENVLSDYDALMQHVEDFRKKYGADGSGFKRAEVDYKGNPIRKK